MKIEFAPSPITKGLYIPSEISDKTSLKDADRIDAYACNSAVLLLDKKMTPWQLVKAVDMLNTVATSLIMRLEKAARDYEESCRQISVPEELLKLAGIPFGAPLDISAGDGEIYISVAEEDDPLEHLPRFLREFFDDEDLDSEALRLFLNSEESVYE